MELIGKLVVGGKPTNDRRNFIWNMVGSMIFAISSMGLSFFMIHYLGEDIGGTFSIAITLSQWFAFIAYYEIRTFQVTDAKNKYSVDEYHGTKIILCVLMMAVCVIYELVRGDDLYKAAIILLMCGYRMLDAYADLYEGTFQWMGRLDLTGKSQCYRTILSVAVMVIATVITKNMMLSIILGIIAGVVGIFIFNVCVLKTFIPIRLKFNKTFKISADCFSMFVGAFLWTFILSASRIAIDANMASEFSSYYQVLFMPVSVINLCATFVMKPELVPLTKMYEEKDNKGFIKRCAKIFALIGIVTVVCVVGAYLVGIPVLEVLAGCLLSDYKWVLVLLMLAGGINSVSYFMYYILSIMRKKLGIFAGYVIAAVGADILSNVLVKTTGVMGGAVSFLIAVSALTVIFAVIIVVGFIRRNKRSEA